MSNQFNPQDEPVYWFVRLEKARERGDAKIAAEAISQLARLGVAVKVKPQAAKAKGASHAS